MMKIKIITGYRSDQAFTIGIDEAHKAYYLFLNPEKRGIFSNGLAITGKQIQSIAPDYIASMGWNPMHTIDTYDWNTIRSSGLHQRIHQAMERARQISTLIDTDEKQMRKKLLEFQKEFLPEQTTPLLN